MSNKKINFSNIFSIRKSPRIISGLSQTTPTRFNKSNSPVLVEITSIPTYSGMKKLKLNKEAMDKIHYTQEIEEVSSKQFNKRLKDQQLYMNYTINPFTQISTDVGQGNLKADQYSLANGQKSSDKLAFLIEKKGKNIIEGFTKLKQKSKGIEMMKRIKKMDSNANTINFQMMKNQLKMADSKRNNDKQNIKAFEIQKGVDKAIQRSELDYLNDIVAIKEQSFFTKKMNSEPINIFRIGKYNDVRDKYCGSSVLRKVHFCFDSILYKSQGKSIIDIYDDISDLNRMLLMNHKSKIIPKEFKISAQQITLSLDKIEFRQLMFLCKGQITPKTLISWMGEDLPTNDNKKVPGAPEKQIPIFYRPNQRNREDAYSFTNLQKTDVKYFQNLPLNEIEGKQNVISKRYYYEFQKAISNELQSAEKLIGDKQFLQKTIKEKDRILEKILEENADYRNSLKFSQEIERKIRSNKLNKNRTEKIKTERLTQTFIFKKKSQYRYRAKTNSRNKKYMVTWR